MNTKSEAEGWKRFLKLCAKTETLDQVDLLFDLFLTLEEKEMLGQRCLIVKALLEGRMPQREIAEKYKVSISQITRGSNALKRVDEGFKRFLQTQLK